MTILIDSFRPNYDLSAVGMRWMKSRCNWGIGLKPCWRSWRRTELCFFFYFSIWPLDLFAWLSLCVFLSSSPLPSPRNRGRSYFGDVEYFRGYSRAVAASVSVLTPVLAFYHAASFCSLKKKKKSLCLVTFSLSQCARSLFPPSSFDSISIKLFHHTSENPVLNALFPNPKLYPVYMVPRRTDVM